MQGGSSAPRQSFAEHMQELRQRLTYVLLALVAGSVAGYLLHKPLLHILAAPLNQQLYYTSPLGGFNALIKISVLFGVVLAVPVAMYQLAKFLAPAFRTPDRLRPLLFVLASLLLAIAGIATAYFISLPAALHFLSQVSGSEIKPFIVVNDYLNFVLAYLVGFALLFQVPLVMLFINRIKPQRPRKLMSYQRWVILTSFVLAAILTPTPDPFNQTLMAAPMIVLYQVGVLAVWVQNRRQRKHSRPAEAAPMAAEEAPAVARASAPRPRPQPRYFDIIPPHAVRQL
ncbi:MAG: twin-arginine translocase subunit TatC [Rhizobiaceae bacterium]|nr:MAG: twin-arginine translocase subunit TatC [Rhizobiaceae bacterium]